MNGVYIGLGQTKVVGQVDGPTILANLAHLISGHCQAN